MPHVALATLMLTLVVAACGNQGGGTAARPKAAARTPAAAATTASPGELLFAALEPGGDLSSMRDTAVAIVRLNGTAAAKASFTARQLPRIGNALPLAQPEAVAAAGRVYFADGTGTVRALTTSGAVSNVTSFPLTSSQQLLSFAVSRDGSQVMGTVFSFPPVHSPPPQTPMDPPFGPGDFAQQVLAAKPGQAPTSLYRTNWPQSGGQPRNVLAVVGWSTEAPLATIDTTLGSQQGSLGRRTFGHVAELDPAGHPAPPLGGYNCDTWSVLADETVLCDDDGQLRNFSIRSRDGTVRFQLHATGQGQLLYLSLSPDAARVAYLGTTARALVTDASGKTVSLPANFRPQGWLDASNVIGVVETAQGDGNMALVNVNRPTRLTDLGFRGFFVGVVQGG